MLKEIWEDDAAMRKVTAAWTGVGCVAALALVWIRAPYSRFFNAASASSSNLLLTITIPGRVAWTLMEAVSPLAFALAFASRGGDVTATVLPWLWAAHYAYRSFVYPWLRASMQPMPLWVALCSASFNVANGALNGRGAASCAECACNGSRMLVAVGVLCWALGFAGNVDADETTRRLRRSPKDAGRYVVPPPRGMHRFLASPNYTCEAFEWLGYAVVARMCPASLSFFLWTLANLVPRAVANRRWYLEKFGKAYPQSRKIFIPFIW